MKKNIGGKIRKKRAATERKFIITESYNGTHKLSEIVSDLIFAEYSRREKTLCDISEK
ncbi:hypothetical protein FACS1894211_00760 [Clostridia bacterium]|nr:hypothetical protein FACS1894211_00760 [Clostridia bacterium]